MEPPEKRKLEDSTQDGPGGATDKRPRVIGPSLPPRSETAQDSASNSEGSDSDSDDDDFGPSLPPPEGAGPAAAPESSGHGPSIPAPSGSGETDAAEPATSRRDDWMLQPPDDASWATRVDPTKLRNRKFQSGKPGSSRPAASGGGGVDASWTETPEQKMRRLQDEVLGVSSAGSGSGGSAAKKGEEMADSKRAQAMAERVEKFNVCSSSVDPLRDGHLWRDQNANWV